MGNRHKSSNEKQIEKQIASDYFPKDGYQITAIKLEPIARVLLMGVYDDNNPLSTFRGMRYIIQRIWEMAVQFNKLHYLPYVKTGNNPLFGDPYLSRWYEYDHEYGSWENELPCAFAQVPERRGCHETLYQHLVFPAPLKKEININMMPIKMDPKTIKKQLPSNLKGYADWVQVCLKADLSQTDKICFLTIHESFVKKGRTQRRPGLHIELPGRKIGGDGDRIYAWGDGYRHKDGIYMASNVDNSCAVWNVKIVDRDDKEQSDIVGELGNMEHIRAILPEKQRYLLESHKLYWITDRTPHEALPMEKDGWRQFFRLVGHRLSVWYEEHSTKNPTGVKPNKKITKIIKGSKFG